MRRVRHEYPVLRPGLPNHSYVQAIQETNDLRHARGISHQKTWIKYVDLDQALASADYVSVHVPLLREGESPTPTFHLFNEQTLGKMKPTAYLVNTSRGPVIDEAALAKALRERWIAGPLLTCMRKSLFRRIHRCAIRRSKIAAVCTRTLPAPRKSPVFPSIRRKAWRDDVFKG